jgi:cytokinin trans-hydroxylase
VVLIIVGAVSEFFKVYVWDPRRIRSFMERQGVKGPPPSFMVGNLMAIANLQEEETADDMESLSHDIVGRLLPHYVKYSRIYGKQFILWWGVEARLTVLQPEQIKEILSSKYSYSYGKSHLQQKGNRDFIGKGLLMANGEAWTHQRRIVAPAFHSDKLKGHVTYMVDSAAQMLQHFDEILRKGNGPSEVEVGEHLSRLAADIIARTEFGSSYENGKRIFEQLNLLQQLSSQSRRYLWLPGNRFLPTRLNKELKQRKKQVENVLLEIIQARRDSVYAGRSVSYGTDLLGLMLAETERTISSSCSSTKLTNQQLMDECKTFFFTGHETTALLMTWTMMLLASSPEWQHKARAEALEVCHGKPPSAADLPKLKILGMVLNESLRLYTPASVLPRQAFDNVKVGDVELPTGMSVWIPVLAIHHSKELWGEDANEFNPQRFAEGVQKACKHQMGFLPFSCGPRVCVGQNFAIMEAKVVMTMVLSCFKFTLSPNYRHAPICVLTLKPKHGVPVILERL